MLVATTRAASTVPGSLYSGERRPEGVGFAEITVSIPPDSHRQIGEVQWPASVPGNPATDFVAVRASAISQTDAATVLHNLLAETEKHRVLVFVHGFNNRFEDAVLRFAQIMHDSRAPAVPVLFTWPSRGSLLAYGYDRESTNYSRDALEQVLEQLAADPRVGEISILSHSMGNWLTLEALRQMAIRNRVIDPKIKSVMLAAPDVDVDVFRTQIADIGATRPTITLFVSQDDHALAISGRLWGSTARLGAIEADREPYRSELSRQHIQVVDLTKFQADDDLNHSKFAESPEVVRLIGQRLVEGQTINDARVGVGDRIAEMATNAATAVGSAAGLVLSAPVAVLDPVSRANYGDQVTGLRQSLSDTAHSGVGMLAGRPGP